MPSFRVADFSTHFPGPMATHLLAELGADVLKIENDKTGDGNREIGPFIDGQSVMHSILNAGTRSLSANRRRDDWPEIVAAASRWADVVVVAGSVGELADRGLDFETISVANPDVVYCMLPAYGNKGPWRNTPGHGQNMDAYAGLVIPRYDAHGLPETPAEWRGTGTTVAPLFAALAIVHALFRRSDVGKAQCIEVSVWGAALWSSWRDIVCQANTGERWINFGDMGSRYAMYRTSDDRALLVCPIEQKFWETFCDVLGLPTELRERGNWATVRMDYGKGAGYEGEREQIQSVIGTQPLAHWTAALEKERFPMAPILTLAEVLASDHAEIEGVIREVPSAEPSGRAVRVPRFPIRYSDDSLEPWRDGVSAPPRLGQHNAEALAMIGLRSEPSSEE
jgi:crotonobetainyl-CoA:carnitine CoA-transferase CaiB-like acyl-CoA transferase